MDLREVPHHQNQAAGWAAVRSMGPPADLGCALRLIPMGLFGDRFLREEQRERPALCAGEKRSMVWATGIIILPSTPTIWHIEALCKTVSLTAHQSAPWHPAD